MTEQTTKVVTGGERINAHCLNDVRFPYLLMDLHEILVLKGDSNIESCKPF